MTADQWALAVIPAIILFVVWWGFTARKRSRRRQMQHHDGQESDVDWVSLRRDRRQSERDRSVDHDDSDPGIDLGGD